MHKLVYQGGYHDVYCDGETHISTEGGSVTSYKKQDTPIPKNWTPLDKFHKGGCNCQFFKSQRNKDDS